MQATRGILKSLCRQRAASNSSAFRITQRPQARHGLPRRSCQIRRVPDCGFRFWVACRPDHPLVHNRVARIERHRGPTGHRSDVACIPTDSSRLVVWLPVPLLIGTAFQDFAGVLHLFGRTHQASYFAMVMTSSLAEFEIGAHRY